jgi:hypothetical protein
MLSDPHGIPEPIINAMMEARMTAQQSHFAWQCRVMLAAIADALTFP